MSRFVYLLLFSTIALMPLCHADDCGDDDSKEEKPQGERGHVQLYFSGIPENKVEDPREGYEWPG